MNTVDPSNRPAGNALARCRIGVPESRQLDLFAAMLEQRGATVTRCPLVDIHDSPDTKAVGAWLDDVLAQGLDDMIWLTGEGVRRLRSFAQHRDAADGQATEQRLISRLAAARSVTRGPKPGRELRQIELTADIKAARPTTAGVIDTLSAFDLAARRIGVQLYGTDPNRPLMDFLAHWGAIALPVAPYVYADDAEDAAVLAFLQAISDGELNAVAFTSSPQIRRLFTVARGQNREARLTAALNGLCVAAVGPLVAAALDERGVRVTLMPDDNYFMKPLVRSLVGYFQTASAP